MNSNSDAEHEPEDETNIALCLVHDLLECLNLKYTNSVFKNEAVGLHIQYVQKTRSELEVALHLSDPTVKNELIENNHQTTDDEQLLSTNGNEHSNDSLSKTELDERNTLSNRIKQKPLLFEILKQYKTTKIQQSRNASNSHNENISFNTETYIEMTQTSANQTSESL